MAFENAEKTQDETERAAAMTFVIVGGGPTGVELAGAIAEIARVTLIRDFRHIDSSKARVFLIGGGAKILAAFSGELPESARRQLTHMGVEVRLGARVEQISEAGVTLKGGEKIAARTVIWAAGNAASPLGASLGVPLDPQGRVIVKEDCSIPGHGEVFVIGDQAHFATGEGRCLPGLSPVAMQQGRHAAKNIKALLRGQITECFQYSDKGTMAAIGRNAAVAEVGSFRFSGIAAWFAWLFVPIVFLVGFRNRITVLFNWAYAYLTYGRGARLITANPANYANAFPSPQRTGRRPEWPNPKTNSTHRIPTGRQALALVGWLALCFAAAGTAAFVSADGWYLALNKPSWNPPAWVFGPAWTVLYATMAVAAWLVWREGGWRAQGRALRMFVLQWALNALWTPLFFALHRPGLALLDIFALWLALAMTLVAFWRVRQAAGVLLLPYLAWVTFATALNFTIWRLNP